MQQRRHHSEVALLVFLSSGKLAEKFPLRGGYLHKRVIVIIGILIRHHVGILVWVLLLGSIWLTLVDLIIVVLVERIWCAEAVEAITLLCYLGADLHKGVIVIIGILIRHHVSILVWVLLLGSIWLALIDLIIVVLVEWIWCAEAIEAITLLCYLGADLDERVIVIVGILIRHHVGILIW